MTVNNGHIIRTPQEIAKLSQDYKNKLRLLITSALGAKVPTDVIVGELYDYVIIALIDAANDEAFIEKTIASFTETLREAVKARKEPEDDKSEQEDNKQN